MYPLLYQTKKYPKELESSNKKINSKEEKKYPLHQGQTQDFKPEGGGGGDMRKKKFQIRIHIVLINYNPNNQGQFFEIVFERLEHPHFPELEHPHFLELE